MNPKKKRQKRRKDKKLHLLQDLTVSPIVNYVGVYTNILLIIILSMDLRMEIVHKKNLVDNF